MASVLAVDDSPSLRKLVVAVLTEAGHTVVEAQDGQEALAMAREHAVQLVVTDVNMPKMDGLTLVRELRTLAPYKYIPILVLTTEMDPAKKAEAKASGATGWLVKPFDPNKLQSTIRRVLG